MSKPSARVSDMHVCPLVDPGPKPHVGGPILPPCAPTVLVGFLPAARVTDMATCVGPPDSISVGSLGVIIGNLCAARMGDPTLHGGVIVGGQPTVLIGEVGNPLLGAAQAINPLGGTINCGHNLDAAISRLDGTNPNATSPLGRDGTWDQIAARHSTSFTWGQTLGDAFDQVRAGGHGTTAVVGIIYPGGTTSHVVPVTNHYGTPVLVEGQLGGRVFTDAASAEAQYGPENVGIAVLPNRHAGF